jgi:Carboxypeptidase regulatory-like domain
MRIGAWLRVVVAAGAVVVCAGVLPGGQGLKAEYSLQGTVVNSETGEPIHNALVTLDFGESRSVFSKVDGSFEFRNVEAGQGSVFVKRPGYFPPQMARMSRFATSTTSLAVTIGPDQPPLVLRLVPEGIIAGRVTGEGGTPIESIGVRIFFEGAQDGRHTLVEAGGIETDGKGEFRKAELPPGRYFVFVGPGGEPEQGSNAKGAAGFGYGSGFYPGGAEFDAATPIDVTPGKQADVDVKLSTVPFFRVSGTVLGIPPGNRAEVQILDSAGNPFDSETASARGGGKFRFPALAAGSYTLEVKDQQETVYATRPLLLKSDMARVDMTLAPGASIPVSVKVEADPTGVRVEGPGYERITRGNTVTTRSTQGRLVNIRLVPRKTALLSREGFEPSTTGSREEYALEHVQAGTYEVSFETGGSYYVQSAVSGATDLLRESLTVAPGAEVAPIRVVLRDDFGSIEGKIAYDPNKGPAIVLAISEDMPQQHYAAQINSRDGTYSIVDLAPGNYRMLAVDRLDNFAYAEPDVMRKYESKMKEVTIGAKGTAHVDLETVNVVGQTP